MRLLAFPQWDKLMSLLLNMARQSAADYAQRKIVRIIPKNSIAHLIVLAKIEKRTRHDRRATVYSEIGLLRFSCIMTDFARNAKENFILSCGVLSFCTGMMPLARKLFKAGYPLAACIFMRGAIYYLMGTGNSRYYNDVHAHRRTLAEMAASVKDWETVEPQCSFDSDFAADFASRRTFWL